jgi:hypothetical protein
MRWIPGCEKGLSDDHGSDIFGIAGGGGSLTAPLAKWTSPDIPDVDADL